MPPSVATSVVDGIIVNPTIGRRGILHPNPNVGFIVNNVVIDKVLGTSCNNTSTTTIKFTRIMYQIVPYDIRTTGSFAAIVKMDAITVYIVNPILFD